MKQTKETRRDAVLRAIGEARDCGAKLGNAYHALRSTAPNQPEGAWEEAWDAGVAAINSTVRDLASRYGADARSADLLAATAIAAFGEAVVRTSSGEILYAPGSA